MRTVTIRRYAGSFCSALLLLVAAPAMADLPSFERVRVLEQARPIADMQLTDVNGEPYRISELHGRVALVFFGFTNCPDVCPAALAKLMELDRSGRVDEAEVAIVMVSVDGERDTPEVMKTFLANFSDGFIGLTGDPQAVKPLAKAFRASFFKGSPQGGGYQVSHSPQVFVLDPRGQLRAEMYNAPLDAMVGLTDALLEEHTESVESSGP